MIAHGVQNETLVGQESDLKTDYADFATSPAMLHSSSPTPELFDISGATTVNLHYNMTAFTQAIKEKEKRQSTMFLDERYMSSEEALSLSPAGDDLNLTDAEYEDLAVDDVLEDIMEDDEEMQYNRSRSNSADSFAIIDCAEVKTIVHIGRAKLVDIKPCSSVRPTTTSSLDDGSVFVTPNSSPETTTHELEKPSLPQRIRPTLQSISNSQSSSLNTSSLAVPLRKENLPETMVDAVETIIMTPQSVFSTPVTFSSAAAITPFTPATPITPTKSSFLNKVGSRISNLSKKEKRTALRISAPTDFRHVNASTGHLSLLSSPGVSDVDTFIPETPSRAATTTFSPMTPSNKVIDPNTFPIASASKSSRPFFGRKDSINLGLSRTISSASKHTRLSDLIQPREEKSKRKEVAAQDPPTTPTTSKSQDSASLADMLNESRLSFAGEGSAVAAAAHVPKRKPVPNSGEKSKKRMSLLGLKGHGVAI